MKLLKSLLSAAAVACLVAAPLSAQAGPVTMKISDGTTTYTIVDGGLGDLNSVANAVTFSGVVGSWTLNVSSGVGAGYTPGVYGLDLNSLNAVSSGLTPSTLTIWLSQTDLSFGAGTSTSLTGHIGGTHSNTAGNLSYSLYTDNTNSLFGTGNQVFTATATGLSYSDNKGGTASLVNPYSMTIVTALTYGTLAGQSSYDFQTNVPEPASIALVGLALVGLGAASRRRKS